MSLTIGQMLRHMHLKPNVKIAPRAAAEARESFLTQPQHRSRLSSRGDRHRNLAVERRYVDSDAKSGVNDIDRLDPIEIITLSHETRIVRCTQHDEEVAGRQSGALGGQTPARNAQRHAFLRPDRDPNRQGFLAVDLSIAAAFRASCVDESAAAVAFGTCRDLLKADAAFALAMDKLSAPAAFRAIARRCTGFRA